MSDETGTYVEYSSNNSGGSWWLSDDDWRALEKAGWEVEWFADRDSPFGSPYDSGRFLGALASRAKRHGLSLGDAIREWELVTGENSADLGCSCCGTPHSFSLYVDGQWAESYSPNFPDSGNRYED